ncbi:MAG: Zn-ribbon domain-containing OB-fold protein [Syntrophales bacterium]
MAKEYRTIRNDVALPYQWALGSTWTRFFDGLKEEKILATKCLKCGKISIPARSFCPECFADRMEWVEAGQEGKIMTWTLVNAKYYGQVKDPPYVIALIQLDGTDCGFSHYIGGIDLSDLKKVRQKLKTGTKVKAVWNPEKKAAIQDIEFFTPVK